MKPMELMAKARELCNEIEALPASYQQNKCSTMANDLHETIVYEEMYKEAIGKGWAYPVDEAFPKRAWIWYWHQYRAYEAHEDKSSMGRPIAPHRSGSG